MPKRYNDPPKRRAAPADTTRLKRDIARADSTMHGLRKMQAESSLPAEHPAQRKLTEMRLQNIGELSAKNDTLAALRRAKPPGTHKSFAENVDAFDGAALGERPPTMSIPRGHPTPDRLPSAVGRPAIQAADGTDNIGANYACFETRETRRTSSGVRATGAAVDSYADGAV